MKDLKSTTAIFVKGALFLALGLAAALLLFAEAPTIKVAVLLAIAI